MEQPATELLLWNVRECAKYLGKSPRWLWNLLGLDNNQAGSIPHVRIGASPRFIPEDIIAWVRDGCPSAAKFQEWQKTKEKRQNRTKCP